MYDMYPIEKYTTSIFNPYLTTTKSMTSCMIAAATTRDMDQWSLAKVYRADTTASLWALAGGSLI